MVQYTIIRSSRKTAALVIDSDGSLTVRAPHRLSKKYIDDFVRSKADWIAEKQRDITAAAEKYPPLRFEHGAAIPLLGSAHVIELTHEPLPRLSGERLFVPTMFTDEDMRAWLKSEAEAYITDRVNFYANAMGLTYLSISMSDAKTRWGSCSAKNALRFSWRLIMCPPELIDYVAVHELCHIPHKNHGADFWARVGEILPDHRALRARLKENRRLMDII